jgi:ubiquinone/menaquinone biosynthesis C-methylase UbiE
MTNDIIEYYSTYDEKGRLLNRHSLERIRSQEIILRYLLLENQKIIDIGGAAGVYSFWLASIGHTVDLIDLVPKHIQQVQEIELNEGIKLNSAIVGNALSLPYDDCTYDIALLMGPLYHLQEKEKRIQAIKEATRVLKHGGILYAAAISRFASLLDGFKYNLINDNEFKKILFDDLKNGTHNNETKNEQYFTYSYFHYPNELKEELEKSGLVCKNLLPVEGFGNIYRDIEKRMEDEVFKTFLLECIRLTENEESMMGISNHFMIIGEKK